MSSTTSTPYATTRTTTPSRLLSLTAPKITTTIVSMMLATICTTYQICVHSNHCPPFLPMISDTWVYAPGTYVSRIFVSIGALGLAAVYVFFYFFHEHKFPTHPRLARASLVASLVAAYAMGVVGSVCESPGVKSCEGNRDIHVASAVIFFAWSTAYAVFAAIVDGERRFSLSGLLKLVCAAVSVLAKARFFPSVASRLGAVETFPLLAIFEWSDTFALMIFFAIFASEHTQDLALAYVRAAPKSAPGRATTKEVPAALSASTAPFTELSSFSARELMYITLVMNFACVGLTFVLSTLDGTIHPRDSWPALSDMWISTPSNMISRYMVCLGSLICFLTQIGHFFHTNPLRGATRANLALHCLSWIGLAGLMIVGACNEDENPRFHQVGAAIFFSCHCLYFVLDAWWSPLMRPTRLTVAVAAAAVYFYMLVEGLVNGGDGLRGDATAPPLGFHSLLHGLEWLTWLSFLFALYMGLRTADEVKLAFVRFGSGEHSGSQPLLKAAV